jgi:DNA-directed RNA polymerase subunit RPC12/RpoP
MKGVKISENEIVRRISKKGDINRFTVCPYCGAKIGYEMRNPSRYPFCGHVVNTWEAAGRWYIKFNQFKQVNR